MMMTIIEKLWSKRRDIVSDGYDESLNYLAGLLPIDIHEYATGTECWTWRVPEKWTIKEAYIENIAGERVYDAMEHPLRVVSYSLPVDKVVSRDELLKHVYSDPVRPNAIPYRFKYYDRDWGFCIEHNKLCCFDEAKYRVVIKSEFTAGALKVGDCTIQGKSQSMVIIASHLCHPAMVNDDMSGVAVMCDIASAMRRHGEFNYTYKFLFVPETIGSIAYLSHNEDLIPKMKYGLFLDMLGNDNTHVLQHSHKSGTKIDRVAKYIMMKGCKQFREGEFRMVIGNDEMAFEGPGVGIPMISISRAPYPEYHTSDDNMDIISEARLNESRKLVQDIIETLDRDYIPKRNFKGPVFLSRYGMWTDPSVNPKLYHNMNRIMLMMEGNTSVYDMAEELDMDYCEVLKYVDMFCENGLIEKIPAW